MEAPHRNFIVLDTAVIIAMIVFAAIEITTNTAAAPKTVALFTVAMAWAWWAIRRTFSGEMPSEIEEERRRLEEHQRRQLERLERRKSSTRRVTRLRKGKDDDKRRTVCHRLRGQNTARTAYIPLDTGLHVLRFDFPPNVTVSITLEGADRQRRTTILSRTSPPDSGHVDIETAGEYALTVELFGMAAINEWQIEIEAV